MSANTLSGKYVLALSGVIPVAAAVWRVAMSTLFCVFLPALGKENQTVGVQLENEGRERFQPSSQPPPSPTSKLQKPKNGCSGWVLGL